MRINEVNGGSVRFANIIVGNDSLICRKIPTFAYAARAAQEVIASGGGQLINLVGFLHIDISVLDKAFKTLYSDRILHTIQLCFCDKVREISWAGNNFVIIIPYFRHTNKGTNSSPCSSSLF